MLAADSITSADRRRAISAASANATIWALGNGIISTALVTFLAYELGASVAQVAWILAAPQLAGVLRWFGPQILSRFRGHKLPCLSFYFASVIMLLLLPATAWPGVLPSKSISCSALVVCWCLYHLCEYLGTICLWSWFSVIVPRRYYGRFTGRRELWLNVGRLVGFVVTSGFDVWYRQQYGDAPLWPLRLALATGGALFMGASTIPLIWMIDAPVRAGASRLLAAGEALLKSEPLRRLLLYGICFSAANGVSYALSWSYVNKALGLSLSLVLGSIALMRLGQPLLSTWCGRIVDRFGCRGLMIVCQLIVALAPLLYLGGVWGYVASYVALIAYVGTNVSLAAMMMRIAGPKQASANFSVYFGLTGVVYAVSTLIDGYVANQLIPVEIRSSPEAYFPYFVVAWLLRSAAAIPLLFLLEPPIVAETRSNL
ncbi:MFS transporter [Blastopirellula sp. JC732]|uniref:MFS transporter n=1 Tax=Blastopirellula sediminis TaxID=2894196 RepID=A0A9X1SKL7_9BACT|nr:MFS transporter [Blastopirellula sediminis]MCC9606809.1 MFS transporter [Blastopirellula sediminis]MCC9629894.1 MFS transporter [Blastopirellula sediminis]